MNYLTKVKSSSIAQKIRTITAVLYGPEDSKSAMEVAPCGIDAPPVPGLLSLFVQTSKSTQPVFVGYVNNNQLANPGEVRIFATDASGTEVSRIWQHNNGDIELGGTGAAGSNTNHATQWEALNTALQDYLTNPTTGLYFRINAGIVAAGGTFTEPAPLDITPAKLTKILVE